VIEYLVLPAIALLCVLGSSFLSFKWRFKALFVQAPLGLAAFIVGYFLDNALFFAAPIFLGAFAGYTLEAGKSLQFFVLISAFITSLLYTGNFYYLKEVKNIDMMQTAKEIMTETFNASDLSNEKKTEMTASLNQIMSITKKIIPFSTFIYSLFFSFLTFFVVKVFLSKLKDLSKIKGIESFKVHDYTVFILIAGIAVILYFDAKINPVIFIIGLNAVLITATLYFLQAMGIIGFFLAKKGFPLYIIPVFIGLILFAGMGVVIFTTIIFAGLGTLDLWADFRKIGNPQPK
jgi:hypothetical protein